MPSCPDRYVTLAGPAEAEERIQRSRFVAVAAPAADAATAQAVVDQQRQRFHDARHACFAWRVGGVPEPAEWRQDDGEPSGTAGEPILQAIRRAELHDAVVVVVRYFGGIKLGTGGLSRAYGGVAAAALTLASRREILLGRRFHLDYPYAQQKTVEHLLGAHQGRLEHTDFDQSVHSRLWLPHSTCRRFMTALEEASGGQLRPQPLNDESPT